MREKIIDLSEKIERKKDRERLERNREKLEAVQKLVQCSSCRFRCAMCGTSLQEFEISSQGHGEYAFCSVCRDEFEEFLSISSGRQGEAAWHNREWVDLWSAWLRYRKALAAFMNSAEFKALFE